MIICEVDGKWTIYSVGEGEAVSHDLMVEKAQVIVDSTRTHEESH